MIRSTFRLAPGIGPFLEGKLWTAGILRWDDFPAPPAVALSARVDLRLRAAIARARTALDGGDAEALATMLPRNERWRLYGVFGRDAAFLDVETDGEELTAIGFLDGRGPQILLAGRDLERFPEEARGLKLLETVTGVGRPPHLAGLSGREAVRLWRAHRDGDAAALRLFAEYNLLDAVNLRALMDLGYNRMIERLRLPAAPVPVQERGDVRYDVTKLLLAL